MSYAQSFSPGFTSLTTLAKALTDHHPDWKLITDVTGLRARDHSGRENPPGFVALIRHVSDPKAYDIALYKKQKSENSVEYTCSFDSWKGDITKEFGKTLNKLNTSYARTRVKEELVPYLKHKAGINVRRVVETVDDVTGDIHIQCIY